MVFLAVQPGITRLEFEWSKAGEPPTCIAVVTYENPTIVETVLRLNAKAVLPAPVRSFGLLSALVIARTILTARSSATPVSVRKLESKLAGAPVDGRSQEHLDRTRKVSEGQAYDLIRDQQ